MKADEKARKLLSVTVRLTDLIRQENEFLAQNGRAKDLKDLLSEKQSLSTAYEQHLRSINGDAGMSEVDATLRQRLKDAIESFGKLLEENKIRLEAKIHASRHLFRVISECARERLNEAGNYSETGMVDQTSRQAYRPPVSVGLNQEL